MPTRHQEVKPNIKNNQVVLEQIICGTYFETTQGTKGTLFIQRWINDERLNNDPAKFRYCASIGINRPGTNTWCGAIDIPTADLAKILPWITTTTEQCNEQLRLEDTRVIGEALADLARQFKEFLPTLRAEDDEVKECFARLPAKV